MCMQNLVKLCSFILKILSGRKIQITAKGRHSVTNLHEMTPNNHNLGLVNVNVYTKVGQIMFIHSKDTEQK